MNDFKITIVRARPDQAQALSRIALAAKRHWNYPERWIETWTPQLTLTAEYIAAEEVWAAMVAGKPAGFYSLSGSAAQASLENFWVQPEQMGRGIGAALFAHACARSRELGFRTLNIESDPNAQGFYERMGAHRTGERVGEVDGRPRILPVLEIDL